MTAAELLAHLRALDVQVSADGDRLRLSAPRGVLTPALREDLTARKAELLALLQVERASAATAPLSFAQQRLWFLDQLQPGSAAYNMSGAVRLRGVLDVAALGRAVDEIVRRHAALRTTFRSNGGEPVQVIHPAAPRELAPVDLEGLAADTREARVLQLAREEAMRPFDLAEGPLLRVTLQRLGPDDHVLLVTMHHIVSDAWSLGIFVGELTVLYEAFVAGRPSSLAEPTIQYSDHARRELQRLQGEVLAAQLAYWTRKLGGVLPVLEMPTDRPRPPVRTGAGAVERFVLPERLMRAVREVARREQATPFMVLLAAFTTLLHRYTGQTDIMVGTPIANRTRLETEGLIGLFANTLVLRTDLSGGPSFGELLQRLRVTALEAYAHQDVPFEKLVEVLQPARDMSRSPLFDVMFGLQNAPRGTLTLPGLTLTPLAAHSASTKVDLTVQLSEHGNVMGAAVEYSTDLFEAATVRRLWAHYETLLEAAVADPARPIAALPLLTADERRQLLTAWQGVASSVPAVRWPVLFEQQVARTPDAVAVLAGTEEVTYAELNRRANQVAHHLRARGVGPDVLVAVALERSLDLLVALLGVLKAGGAYVPLDPAYPPQRLAFVLADAGVALLVTHDLATLPPLPGPIPTVRLDADAALLVAGPTHDPELLGTPEDLAYVIYTSGSTGTPKGVEVPHRALVNLLLAMAQTPGLAARDVLVAVTSLSFDIAALELFLPLVVGARVVIAGREDVVDGARLGRLLAKHGATVMQATPSTWRLLLDSGWPGQPGLRAFCGGEALPAALAGRLLGTGATVWNLYGPTETTIWSTVHAVRDGEPVVPIGRPIANTRAYVLDADRQPAPLGVSGELYLGGLGVARGYRGRPELTAERFVADPFDIATPARLYRTGDVVRWRADGTLEFLGRADDQVKVRGYRIEPGEIEAALVRHPDVREAVVVARETAPGDQRLVAYVVPDAAAPDAAGLRAHLTAILPAYMLPEYVVALPALPLTPNGKIDRRALPAPTAAPTRAGDAPRTPAEELIADVWADVLEVPRVGVHDGFFDLGGHSLLAARVAARLREALGMEVPVREIFEAPTVAGLAERLEHGRRSGERRPLPPPLGPSPRTGRLALSFAQERLWFFDRLEPGSGVYNIAGALVLRGHFDVSALERSVTILLERHEALRTTFPSDDGRPVAVIQAPAGCSIPVIDLHHVAAAERDAEAARLVAADARQPFDLARGPLLRVRVFRLEPERHVLLVVAHHIVVDGAGFELLARELGALYAGDVTGRPPTLASLPIQYADFVAWQRAWLSGLTLETELAYWKRQLAGAPPVLDLPADRPRAATQTFSGGRCVRVVGPDLRDGLHALSRREGATLFMTLLTAFNVVLARQSGQDDVCVGVPVAGRNHPETERLVGLFINTLVLRTRLDRPQRFRELLKRVRETALEAYAHQDVPFEKLVAELAPARDLSRTPLFQVVLNMMNFGSQVAVELPGIEVDLPDPSATGVLPSKFDLTVYARDAAEGLRLTAVYNADLFDGKRMEDLLEQLVQLLGAVRADPDLDVGAVSLVTPAAARLLPDPLAALAAASGEPVTARFRRHAERAPDHPAVVTATDELTYGQLEALSNRLANFLIERGVGRKDLVAIHAHRSSGLAWAMLGALKAGAAFVCLDPAYPSARHLSCLQIAPPRAYIHLNEAGPLPAAVAAHLGEIPDLVTVEWPARSDAGAGAWSTCADDAPRRVIDPDDLAYVAFTSGSTGVPKGIAGTHAPLAHFFAWHAETSGLRAADRFATLSGLAHDPLLRDVLGAFWLGATVCMPDPIRLGTPAFLRRWLAEQRVSVMHVTPAMATILTETADGAPVPLVESLRHVFFGGDVLTADMVDRVRRIAPHARCVNFYGTTETPQAAAWYEVPEDSGAAGPRIPLGRGIADVQLLVVNAAAALAGVGEIGEIQVRTPFLSLGYVNDPASTADRFVASAFTKAADDRVYRTGDQGRYRPDGTVEFCGRDDGQVKVRGFRVELGDVESALRRHPGVDGAVVLVRAKPGGEPQLVAYVAGRGSGRPSPDALRQQIARDLPAHMVPSVFVVLERLPLTPNGKIDTAALPAPTLPAASGGRAPATSTETVLAKIWSDVLGVEALGVDESFFDLGGQSLLAVTLFARIERAFGVALPLATIFQAQTIERQAELLNQGALQAPWRALVPIQPAGSRPPLFALPGIGGSVVSFNGLARLLGPDQPFYGLEPRGLDGKLPPFSTIEAMAEHYLQEVRALQPQGPYYLMGACMGGVVAFEMSRRLHAVDQEVAFLALLDVRPPIPRRRWMRRGTPYRSAAFARLLTHRLTAYTRALMQRPSRRQVGDALSKLRRLLTLVSAGDPLRGARGEIYQQIVTAANVRALGRYVPRLYAGSLILVMAADRQYRIGKDRRLDWQQFAAGGFEVCVVPGADSGLALIEPNVRTLADHVATRLKRAQARTLAGLVAVVQQAGGLLMVGAVASVC